MSFVKYDCSAAKFGSLKMLQTQINKTLWGILMQGSAATQSRLWIGLLLAISALLSSLTVLAQTEETQIQAEQVAKGIYMRTGRGGNIGLSAGEDATFIIDDQFAPLTDTIVTAIAAITDRPVDYALNTHWHGDHTGGNENFGKQGALIMAHAKVRSRMTEGCVAGERSIEPAPKVALPVVTFNDALSLHVNSQTIKGIHIHHAHTDGDVIVYFRAGNVIHMGDTFFSGRHPYIDLNSGGHIDGVIKAAEVALTLGDESTKIIPEHGQLASKADLQRHYDMVVEVRAAVAAMIDSGKTHCPVRWQR
ncbi:MAG: cyclase [Glaciecola sp.]